MSIHRLLFKLGYTEKGCCGLKVVVKIDLSLAGCKAFWDAYPDADVVRIVKMMEHVESWAIDIHPEMEVKLKEFQGALLDLQGRKIEQLDVLVQWLSHVRMARKLQILHVLDQLEAGLASRMIQYAEAQQYFSPHAELFFRRNLLFERLRMMARVMSKDRISQIRKVLEHMDSES